MSGVWYHCGVAMATAAYRKANYKIHVGVHSCPKYAHTRRIVSRDRLWPARLHAGHKNKKLENASFICCKRLSGLWRIIVLLFFRVSLLDLDLH